MPDQKIFVSYSNKNSEIVLKLVTDLVGAGGNLWLDRFNIAPGLNWDTEISKALEDCNCLLFIASQSSVISVHVLNEIHYAIEEKKKILPVKIENCKFPILINRLQYIDLSDNYDKGLKQLITALNLKKKQDFNELISLSKEDSGNKVINNEIEAWNQAETQNTRPAYERYLNLFPEGKFKSNAIEIINKENANESRDVKYLSSLDNDTLEKLETAFAPTDSPSLTFSVPFGKSILKENIDTNIVKTIFPKHLFKTILSQKLNSDFDKSFLKDVNTMHDGLADSIKILKRARMIKTSMNESRILRDELSYLKIFTLLEVEVSEFVKNLKISPTIKVSCTSIHPATISVFKSLSSRLKNYSINLEISFEDINGHYQVLKSKKNKFDFAVFPNDAFFMIENSGETVYRLVFTVNKQIQYLFRRKTIRMGKKNQVHVYQDSSAHMQRILGVGIPIYSKNKIIEAINDFSLLIQEMEGGDMIIVWEPLSKVLFNSNDFELIPGSEYEIMNSLFCHKSWNTSKMNKAREAFKALFLNEWRICEGNRNLAMKLLLEDEDYLKLFADGAGISF